MGIPVGIPDRIKELRKSLNLTQSEFGDSIGLSRAAVGAMENEFNGVSDRNIQLISKQFAVSEEWLRTGEGDMFSPLQDDLDYLVGMYGDKVTPNIRAIVEMMLTLDEPQQKQFDEFVDRFMAAKARIEKKDQE